MKLVTTLLSLAIATPAAAADLDISKYTKVYVGEEGLTVTFVELRSKAGALIKVSGVDTEIDGVVMRYEVVDSGRDRKRYHTELHGERFGTFHTARARGNGDKSVFIFLPEAPMQRLNVRYDEAKSKAQNSDNLLTAYRSPKNQKAIKKLAAWNRGERVKKQNAWYEEEADAARKKCGAKIAVSIDWKSVKDDHLKEYSIYGYCSAPLGALRQVCDGSKEYQTYVQKKVKKVRCRFGDELKLELKPDGVLMFTTATEAPNQQDFAKKYLKDTL